MGCSFKTTSETVYYHYGECFQHAEEFYGTGKCKIDGFSDLNGVTYRADCVFKGYATYTKRIWIAQNEMLEEQKLYNWNKKVNCK